MILVLSKIFRLPSIGSTSSKIFFVNTNLSYMFCFLPASTAFPPSDLFLAPLNFFPDKKAAFQQSVPQRQLPGEHIRRRHRLGRRRRGWARRWLPLLADGPAPGHDDHVQVLLSRRHSQQAILRRPVKFMLMLRILANMVCNQDFTVHIG